MKVHRRRLVDYLRVRGLSLCLTVLWVGAAQAGSDGDRPDTHILQPVAVQAYGDRNIVVLNATGRSLAVFRMDPFVHVRTVPLPAEGMDLTLHGHMAYVTTGEPAGRVLVYDLRDGVQSREIAVGHTPMSPVVTGDGKRLCVACRFENAVAVVDLDRGTVRKVDVIREPIALAVDSAGRRLYVANHLPEVRPFDDEDFPFIAAEVSVIDLVGLSVQTHIALPNGSHSLRDAVLSPDGRFLVVSHIQSNFAVPPLEIKRGAMNMNVLSLVDTATHQRLATVSLDDPHRGAANPWALAFADRGERLLVTHAGTHELSVIDFKPLMARMQAPDVFRNPRQALYRNRLQGIRRRIPLGIHGPRSLCVTGDTAVVAGAFSDTVSVVTWDGHGRAPVTRDLPGGGRQTQARRGEHLFNDARLCFEGWQSCASCHPDGRRDAMYWDLSNDGLGTFKDTKSLLMATRTPPVMWRGVRADAMTAIRAGIHHIQFALVQPGQAEAIHAYLDAMPLTASPHLDPRFCEEPKTEDVSCTKCHAPGIKRGTLTAAAQRGKLIFAGKAGCVECHPHPLFTNLERRDPGLGSGVLYDVPSLVEVWRTAPYLHNGDALTIREAITDYNWMQKRGRTRDLDEQELADLIAYVKSL